MHPPGCCTDERLSVFNQCSPRNYICVVLCFPCDDRRRDDAVQHLRHSLEQLTAENPIFSARLYTAGDGIVLMRRSCLYDIPFEVIPSKDGEEIDYEQMKREGFPPGRFIKPRYGPPGLTDSNCGPIPVSKVQVSFARGGLLLSVFLQHAVTDGSSLRVFLEAIGNRTRNVSAYTPSEQRFRVASPILHSVANRRLSEMLEFRECVAACPEYAILSDHSGPTQPLMQKPDQPIQDPERIGKIFVFTDERLGELRDLIQAMNKSDDRPTAYMSLATLAYAHITKARIESETFPIGLPPGPLAQLWNSVNWRPRAFLGATDNYFGNAVLPAVTKVPRDRVSAACDDDKDLACLVPIVKESIGVVEEEYVTRRMSMMSLAPDPRLVGVNYDPRSPEMLAFNTWRHFGADVEWHIPGVQASKPDTIRRATGGWGLGTALILPAKKESRKQELFVSLSVNAMQALCKDERWMRWVDRTIG
ncbi:hypothetical protein NPX13_g1239 [Xylaria arbuscula]|uniref:Uncharacterized protein n=1 Tax=Xylaria arbuscula TaxID=114810 RepID=A0A9W8NMT2_9PEZI|nr:hypothetical protein NPX13_g1239 [Xylaria arbuscula]